MSFDNSNHFNQRQDVYTSQRVRKDGLIVNSTRNTSNSVYLPKTPYLERQAKSRKGFNGFSAKQNEDIDLAIYTLGIDYGFQNCKWLVLTFDENTSNEALINLLTNFKAFDKAIKYAFKKAYKYLGVEPYVIVYGLQERTSYSKNIPCFDVNILCAVKNKQGDYLLNELTLINNIYLAASKQAKERIEIPSNYYNFPPDNTLENYRQLSNYLKIQVSLLLLKHFQRSEYASLLPNTYVHIPTSLKAMFVNQQVNYQGSNASEHRELLRDKFSDSVTIHDKKDSEYKCIAQLNIDESQDDFVNEYQREYALKYPDRVTCNSVSVQCQPKPITDFEHIHNYQQGGEYQRITENEVQMIKLAGSYGKGCTTLMQLAHSLVELEQELPQVFDTFMQLLKIAIGKQSIAVIEI